MAQWVKLLTLDFSSGHDLVVCGFESWVVLSTDGMKPDWDSFSPSLSAPSPFFLSLSK